MAKRTELRVPLTSDKAGEAFTRLIILSVIRGVSVEASLTAALNQYTATEEMRRGTWLPMTELIARLKSDYDLQTTFQTLNYWRRTGRLDGIYFSDGESKTFYLLEKVAELVSRPRTRARKHKDNQTAA